MKRTKIVAGNWKMNKNFQEADELIANLVDFVKNNPLENTAVSISHLHHILSWLPTRLMNLNYI